MQIPFRNAFGERHNLMQNVDFMGKTAFFKSCISLDLRVNLSLNIM